MPALAFKARFVEPILRGEKTSTIRKWVPHSVDAGVLVDFYNRRMDPPFCTVRITRRSMVTHAEFNEELAKQEGFDSPEELHKALDDFYPAIKEFVMLEFELVRSAGK